MGNLHYIKIIAAFFLFFILPGTAEPLLQTEGRGAENYRKGMEYYNEAFYRALPQGRHQEAERFFDLATIELQNAIAASPQNAEAHRNLARLYYVRKQFPKAAHAYRTLTILEPQNIDTYVQLALCYTKLNQFDEAIQALEIAKTKAADLEVIGKLDQYIGKIMDHRQD